MDSRNRLHAALFGGTPQAAWVADGVLATRHGDCFVLESVVNGRLVSVEIRTFIGPFMGALRDLLERTVTDPANGLRSGPLALETYRRSSEFPS